MKQIAIQVNPIEYTAIDISYLQNRTTADLKQLLQKLKNQYREDAKDYKILMIKKDEQLKQKEQMIMELERYIKSKSIKRQREKTVKNIINN